MTVIYVIINETLMFTTRTRKK